MIKTGQIFLLDLSESIFVCRDFEDKVEHKDFVAIWHNGDEITQFEVYTEISDSYIFCVEEK